MTGENLRQAILDEEHLKLLSIGFIIEAGMNALFSLFGFLYVFMGIVIEATLAKMPAKPDQAPFPHMGLIFAGMGLVFFGGMITLAVLKGVTALYLKRRKGRVFCMVTAALSCVLIPYGTLLGVLTLIVLSRHSVKQLFKVNANA